MLNFFNPAFQEQPTTAFQFGLCDNEDGTAAFTDTANRNNWTAVVNNPNGLTLVFTAIDKNVVKDDEYSGYERCDGMLVSNEHLYFIELKNERGDWIPKGISQLGSTIELFNNAHPEKKGQYSRRKAFIYSRKHPHFHVINNEQNLGFFRTYGFRLDIQAEILMV